MNKLETFQYGDNTRLNIATGVNSPQHKVKAATLLFMVTLRISSTIQLYVADTYSA